MRKACGDLPGCPSDSVLAVEYDQITDRMAIERDSILLRRAEPDDLTGVEGPRPYLEGFEEGLNEVTQTRREVARMINAGDRRPACIGVVATAFCGVTYKVECPIRTLGKDK